jgi:hypothetical protein
MERCVIHHTPYIVPSSKLPALKVSVPGRAPWPLREQESPSRHVLTACHIIFPCGGSDPSSNPLLSPWDQRPLYKALQAKQRKIDALWTAVPGRAWVQYREQVILPYLWFPHWTPNGSLGQGGKNSTFVQSQAQMIHHTPLISQAWTSYLNSSKFFWRCFRPSWTN